MEKRIDYFSKTLQGGNIFELQYTTPEKKKGEKTSLH